MSSRKETVEYSARFIEMWNAFCLNKGCSKRQASHGALWVFMTLTDADDREMSIAEAQQYILGTRKRLGPRTIDGKKIKVEIGDVLKETIEYDSEFIDEWDLFCHSKGFVKRHAAVAARLVFMKLPAADREEVMEKVMLMGRERAKKTLPQGAKK